MATDAVVAFLTRGVEWHDDLIADVEFGDRVAFLDDLADELVAEDEIGWAFEMAAVRVEIAAAEGGAGYFDDGVGGLLDLRVRAIFYGDLREDQLAAFRGLV